MMAYFWECLKKDYACNDRRRIILLLFLWRILSLARQHIMPRILFFPLELLYRFYSEVLLSIELRPGTSVGAGLRIDHGFGIVININSVIGSDCHLRHGVTIGCKMNSDGSEGPSPVLGDNVEIGCSASIIGDITLGNNCRIGVGAVVLMSVPTGTLMGGNPAKIIARSKK